MNEKDRSMLLALALFVGAGLMVFFYLSDDSGSGAQSPTAKKLKSNSYEKNVNKHLLYTNEKIELSKKKIALDNQAALIRSYNNRQRQVAYENSNGLDMSYDSRSQEMAKELGRENQGQSLESPNDVVQYELKENDLDREHDQEYRIEYARQFIDNARRGGYDVKLSADLSRVISVKPLRPGQNLNGGPVGNDRGSSSGMQ